MDIEAVRRLQQYASSRQLMNIEGMHMAQIN